MLVTVFSSVKKAGYFIYVPFASNKKEVADYDNLDESVVKLFQSARLVTSLDLTKKKLAHNINQDVIDGIEKIGFYLQIISEVQYNQTEDLLDAPENKKLL